MNPDSIRALLDGITAGEWATEPVLGAGDEGEWWVYSGHYLDTVADDIREEHDAAFIAASPGIARYALELAAENDRLRAEITAMDAALSAKGVLLSVRMANIEDIARRALAPQPAPTDGEA